MSADDSEKVVLSGTSIQERAVKIDEIIADVNIKDFKPRSRKCRFSDESISKYYDVIN